MLPSRGPTNSTWCRSGPSNPVRRLSSFGFPSKPTTFCFLCFEAPHSPPTGRPTAFLWGLPFWACRALPRPGTWARCTTSSGSTTRPRSTSMRPRSWWGEGTPMESSSWTRRRELRPCRSFHRCPFDRFVWLMGGFLWLGLQSVYQGHLFYQKDMTPLECLGF